jgi:hypothetical protein
MTTLRALQASKQMQGSIAAISLRSNFPCLRAFGGHAASSRGYQPAFIARDWQPSNRLGSDRKQNRRTAFSTHGKELLEGVLLSL